MIQVEQLTKYYHDLCAVDQISFNIQKGEILGLLGPNGAGKTTTLRMLTGYLRPSAGKIQVKNYAIDTDAQEIKKLIGYLPESAPLYGDMLVYDYLNYVADIRGIDPSKKLDRLRTMAGLCGLESVMHQPIAELSKGYKQRVGLAHAMLDDPEILVLDEPTSGLDPNQIVDIREIIKTIGREKTIILSTHILSEAEATCDRVVIIDKGKIIADGDMASLTAQGSNSQTIHLSLQNAAADDVQRKFSAVEGITSVDVDTSEADTVKAVLTGSGPSDERAAIYSLVKATDWVLLELYQEGHTLEKTFRELTREN
jgi:ABC-2 type transport system ATP-binding protein